MLGLVALVVWVALTYKSSVCEGKSWSQLWRKQNDYNSMLMHTQRIHGSHGMLGGGEGGARAGRDEGNRPSKGFRARSQDGFWPFKVTERAASEARAAAPESKEEVWWEAAGWRRRPGQSLQGVLFP